MHHFARTYGALMYIVFCEPNFLFHNKLTYLILPMNETNKTRTYPAVTSERKELFVQFFSGSHMIASYRKVRKCWLSCSPFFLTFLDHLLVQGQRLFESSRYVRSCATSSVSWYFFKSPFMLSLHLFFGRPLLLLPETSSLSDFTQMWLGSRLKP